MSGVRADAPRRSRGNAAQQKSPAPKGRDSLPRYHPSCRPKAAAHEVPTHLCRDNGRQARPGLLGSRGAGCRSAGGSGGIFRPGSGPAHTGPGSLTGGPAVLGSFNAFAPEIVARRGPTGKRRSGPLTPLAPAPAAAGAGEWPHPRPPLHRQMERGSNGWRRSLLITMGSKVNRSVKRSVNRSVRRSVRRAHPWPRSIARRRGANGARCPPGRMGRAARRPRAALQSGQGPARGSREGAT
jgi:hypothetical protein